MSSKPERTKGAAMLALAACLALAGGAADADETTATLSDLMIENATIEAGDAGGDSRIRFLISNDSSETVTVVGLRSPAATSGSLTYFTDHGEAEPSAAMTIKPDETLDFSSGHLAAKLIGLKAPLRPNDRVPFELMLRSGSALGEADVH